MKKNERQALLMLGVWAILWLFILGLMISLIFLASGCVTFRLEHRLKSPIREWYEVHSVLMETKIPDWIHSKQPSEKLHFLRLPEKIQRIYINYFWKIRKEGFEEVFYARMQYANLFCREGAAPGWNTDRGRIIVLCGEPTEIRYLVNGRWSAGGVDINMPLAGDECYQEWIYFQRGVGLVHCMFKWYPPDQWRTASPNIRNLSGITKLEQHWREQFAPTVNGWEIWGSVLAEYLEIFKKEKHNEM